MNFSSKMTRAFSAQALRILLAGAVAVFGVAAQVAVPRTPASSAEATVRLEAEQQRKEGDIFFADGKVEILYRNYRLRADHVLMYSPALREIRHLPLEFTPGRREA